MGMTKAPWVLIRRDSSSSRDERQLYGSEAMPDRGPLAMRSRATVRAKMEPGPVDGLRQRTARWLALNSRSRRLLIALGVYVVCTVVYFACAPREIVTEHTRYNHYALLADAWLHGRLDLGHPPPSYTQNNDFAEYQGRWYVSFPPFPAVLLVPVVKLAGSAENVRDGQVWLWVAGLGPAILFLALEKLRRMGESTLGDLHNALLSGIFAFGTVYFFTAVQGTVWFAALVVAVVLSATYLLAALDAERPLLAGAMVGAMLVTRPHMPACALLFLCEVVRTTRIGKYRLDWPRATRKLVWFALPFALIVAITAWHNWARFGNLDFGHEHLTVGWRARIDKWGLVSYHYLARNLGIVTSSLPYITHRPFGVQINTHGLALWVTTPIYLWLLWPRRAGYLWRVLLASIAPTVMFDLLYQNSGWLQFGYRFSNDFAVLLFAMLAIGGYRMGRLFYSLAAVGVAVNTFGALTFERRGQERFYFTDNSQTIIYQPD